MAVTITADWEVEYGGFKWSSILELDGIDGLPRVRSGNVDRSWADGEVTGPLFLSARVVTLTAELCGDDLRAQLDAMAAATVPSGGVRPLSFRAQHDEPRRLFAQVTDRAVVGDQRLALGSTTVVVQFTATDPRIYADDSERSGTTGVGSITDGLGFPHGFPHGFGEAESGAIETTNAGNVSAPWTATLTGPLSGPFIELTSTGERLSWSSLTIEEGQTLEVDMLTRTAKLNGTASRFPGPSRDWFEIPPGDDSVTLGAAAGSGTLTLRWRDTFL